MEYRKYTVEKLRELCKTHNLLTGGKKEQLIKRLVAHESRVNTSLEFDKSNDLKKESENLHVKEITNNIERSHAWFLKMNLANLPRYLNAGVIYPLALEISQVYKNENRKGDLFSQFEEYIPVVTEGNLAIVEDEVLIELYDTDLKIITPEVGSISLLSNPIPVSRIRTIYFKSNASKTSFLSSIKTFPDCFVPEQICLVANFGSNGTSVGSEISAPENKGIDSWKSKLDRFDKIMGMFAYMKNAGVFFAEDLDQYQEYTPAYFSAAGIINTKLYPFTAPKDSGLFRSILFPSEMDLNNVNRILFKFTLDAIYSNLEFSIDVAQDIIGASLARTTSTAEESRDLTYVSNFFSRLKNHQAPFLDVFKIGAVKFNMPLLALILLARFPKKNRQHTDKQAARIFFITNEMKLQKSMLEFSMAVLGLYYGYKMMVKADTNLQIHDPLFASLADRQQSIKFRMESRLERVLIESIFSWVVSGRTISEEYSFYKPEREASRHFSEAPKSGYEYKDRSTEIAETRITSIERQPYSKKVLDIVDKRYPKHVSGRYMLVNYLIQEHGISNDLLLQLIKENQEKLDIDKIIKIIDIDIIK